MERPSHTLVVENQVRDGLIADWNERLSQEGDFARTIKPFDRLMSFNEEMLDVEENVKKAMFCCFLLVLAGFGETF